MKEGEEEERTRKEPEAEQRVEEEAERQAREREVAEKEAREKERMDRARMMEEMLRDHYEEKSEKEKREKEALEQAQAKEAEEKARAEALKGAEKEEKLELNNWRPEEVQMLPRSRLAGFPSTMLFPNTMLASSMHAWLATGKAESDKEREDKMVDKSSQKELTNTSIKQEFSLDEEWLFFSYFLIEDLI